MTWSAASTIATSRPLWRRFSATSMPMNPPPTTTAVRTSPEIAATMASVSSMSRSDRARSMPGIGGRTGRAPGDRMRASYDSLD